jgi:hypothetical protein
MKKVFFNLLLYIPSMVCAALPPLFPSLLPRLHEAIANGNVTDIQALIALSADPNASYQGRTALQTAVVYKNPDVIGCLISYGVALSDDIIVRLLRSGNERYTIDQAIASLKLLLIVGAHKGDVLAIPRGYLTPVMLAHADSDAIHETVVKMIQRYGKMKIA